jgi:arylsulfatase A-like enzyme
MDFQRIGLAAGNEEIDKTIGLVLARLRDLGALENTYILYTADHGAQGGRANGVLSNGKGTVWEGGLRVPLLVAGPGIKPRQFSHVRASTVDLLPTVLDLAGVTGRPSGLEGVSLAAVLKKEPNAQLQREHGELVIHFPHYDKDPIGPASAILDHDWKLIHVFETGRGLLFDLSKDIGERNDLAPTMPGLARSLDDRLLGYLKSVDAGIPQPNPGSVEGGERSGDRRGGGKGGKKGDRKP